MGFLYNAWRQLIGFWEFYHSTNYVGVDSTKANAQNASNMISQVFSKKHNAKNCIECNIISNKLIYKMWF
jgi:hypothetical protein